jgi:hypothetical protein
MTWLGASLIACMVSSLFHHGHIGSAVFPVGFGWLARELRRTRGFAGAGRPDVAARPSPERLSSRFGSVVIVLPMLTDEHRRELGRA